MSFLDKFKGLTEKFEGLKDTVETVTHPTVETNVKVDNKIYIFVAVIVLLIIFRKKLMR